jgi:protocatechuate 3,4-dioxygenase beta subunit
MEPSRDVIAGSSAPMSHLGYRIPTAMVVVVSILAAVLGTARPASASISQGLSAATSASPTGQKVAATHTTLTAAAAAPAAAAPSSAVVEPVAAPLGLGVNDGVDGMAVGDVNGDSKPDLIVLEHKLTTPTNGNPPVELEYLGILLGNGDRTFGAPTLIQVADGGTTIALSGSAQAPIVLADLKGDHGHDIVVGIPGRSELLVYLDQGGGTYLSTPEVVHLAAPAVQVAAADLGNGHTDVIAAVASTPPSVVTLMGDGSGTFPTQATSTFKAGLIPNDLAVVALTGSGKPDIVVSGYDPGNEGDAVNIGILLNQGAGTFPSAATMISSGLDLNGFEIGNFSGSGHIDILATGTFCVNVTSPLASCESLLPGNGDGTFGAATLAATFPLAETASRGATPNVPMDLDGDGHADAVWVHGTNGAGSGSPTMVTTSYGDGHGGFTSSEWVGTAAANTRAVGVIAADLTGTGAQDLVIDGNASTGPFTNVTGGVYVLPAAPVKPRTYVTGQILEPGVNFPDNTPATATGDFRSTGHQDILTVSGGPDTINVLPGNGDGTFGAVASTVQNLGGPGHGPVVADFNGDGHPDFAMAQAGAPGIVFALGDGHGGFGPAQFVAGAGIGHSIAAVDLTGDGHTDLVVQYSDNTGDYLQAFLWNPTSSTFVAQTPTVVFPHLSQGLQGPGFGVFTSSGHVDAVLASVQPAQTPGGPVTPYVVVLPGDGAGHFNAAAPIYVTPECSAFGGGPVVAGDLNGDGHDDIVFQCGGKVSVVLGNGDGTFKAPTTYADPLTAPSATATGLTLGHIVSASRLDVAEVGTGFGDPVIFPGNSDGTLGTPQAYAAGNDPVSSIEAAPLEGGGLDDLVIGQWGNNGHSGGLLTVLRTTGGNVALAASNVSVPSPSSLVPGVPVSATFTVTNSGTRTATGSWVDSVYLDAGTTYTSGDPLVARVLHSGDVAAGASYTDSVSGFVPAVTAGSYHLVAIPDSGLQLNNGTGPVATSAASPPFAIGAPTSLVAGNPGTAVATTLSAGQTLLYQVTVGASDVRVTTTLPVAGDGAVYAAFNRFPSATDFDKLGSAGATPTLTLASSKPGTWYVAIVGAPAAGAGVPVSIEADNRLLAVASVAPTTASNAGQATVTLQGSGFAAGTTVSLVAGSITRAAKTVIEPDSTIAFATFDLSGLSAGVYDIDVAAGTASVTDPAAFTVTAGGPGVLDVSATAVSDLRYGWVGYEGVTLTNTGGTDIAVPVIRVTGSNDNVGLPGTSDPTTFQPSVEYDDKVLSSDPYGSPLPPGVLPPGASDSLSFPFISTTTVPHASLTNAVDVIASDDQKAIDWTSQLAPLQPSTVSNADWATFVATFAASIGATEGNYAVSLLQAFKEAASEGVVLNTEQDALNFMVDRAFALPAGAPVTGTVSVGDATHPLASAAMTLTDTADPTVVFSTTSWHDGRFAFAGVTPGTYNLAVDNYLPRVAQTVVVAPTALGLAVVVQPGATVTGRVLDSGGNPVANALVTATDSAGSLVADPSAADGSYSIGGLNAGSVDLEVSADGYSDVTPVTVTVTGTATVSQNLTVSADGTISGTIVAPGGGAPSGATVSATSTSPPATFEGVVNADGTFTITNMAPGMYTVTANAPTDGPVSQPNVTVTASQTSAVSLTLAAQSATVTGIVTDTDSGTPISGATVETDNAAGGNGPAVTATNGSFSLGGLAAGTVDLVVIPPDSTHLSNTAAVTVAAGGSTSTTIGLQPTGVMNATVVGTSPAGPLANQQVVLTGPSPSSAAGPEQPDVAFTDANGNVAMTGLTAGTYDLEVPGADAHQTFTIGAGARTATVTVTVPTGTVQGVIDDAAGNPAAGVAVALADPKGQFAHTVTDTTGSYRFTVTATQTVDVVAAGAPVGLVFKQAVAATIGSTTVVPTLQAGNASLDVNVTDAGGPVNGAAVILSTGASNDQPAAVGGATTAGSITIPNLTAGVTYQLHVDDGTDAASTQSVVVAAGTNTENVVLAAGATITGTISDTSLAPVTGATVVAIGTTGLRFPTLVSGSTYTVTGLPADTYNLSVSNGTDAPTIVGAVTVGAAATVTDNVTLPISGSAITVHLLADTGGGFPAVTAVLEDTNGTPVMTRTLGPSVSAADVASTATFAPLVAASTYTLIVSGPGTATVSEPVTVGATVNVAAPDGEGLVSPTPPVSASNASLTSAVASGSRRVLTMSAILDAAPTPPMGPGFWQSVQLYFTSWSKLVPDPGPNPQLELNDDIAFYNNLITIQKNMKCPGLITPQLIKMQHLLTSMRDALSAWQGGHDALNDLSVQYRIELATQAAGTVGSLGLAAAGMVAAGVAVGAALSGVAVEGILSEATISALGLAGNASLGTTIAGLIDQIRTDVLQGNFGDANTKVSTLSNIFSLAQTALTKLVQLNPTAGGISNALALVNNAVSATTGAVSSFNNLKDAGATVQNLASNGNRGMANFNNFAFGKAGFHALLDKANALAASAVCPPPPPPPYPPPPKHHKTTTTNNHTPGDPNEILGPAGVGTPQQWVAGQSALGYTIQFLNVPTATAPAVQVVVTEPLPTNTDPASVQLTGFGYGQLSVTVPPGHQNFSMLEPVVNGDPVAVNGTFDTSTKTITWTMESINPLTGDVDGSPTAGFLPPDDAAGDGEGSVSFQATALPGQATGTTVTAQASIVFDKNAAISTGMWLNTIDAGAPTATVASLPPTSTTPFTVSWSGTDDGSGIATYDVYVSDNGGPFTLWQPATAATSASYAGTVGHTYGFAVAATDNVGNAQPVPTAAQATTTVSPTNSPPAFTTSATTSVNAASPLTFTLRTTGYPIPTIVEAGALPTGITFGDNGDGTATLAGTTTTAGTFPITFTAKNSQSSVKQTFTLTVNPGGPAAVTVAAGSGQSATVSSTFATALAAKVTDTYGNPLAGVTVTFTAPASGPSGSFAGNVNTAVTNAAGVATAPAFSANGTAGTYAVLGAVANVATPAMFAMTNNGAVNTLTLTFSGSVIYTNNGTLTSGTFNVNPRSGTISSISGTATIAGTHGGKATVTFNIVRISIFGLWIGTVHVVDPNAHLDTLAVVANASIARVGAHGATGVASGLGIPTGTKTVKPYTLRWTITKP